MVRVLNKISDAVNNVSKIVCGLLMGYLAIVCTLQVIFRKVLNNSLTWSEESMRYVFIWMILLATATTVKEGSGAAIDLLRKNAAARKADRSTRYVRLCLPVLPQHSWSTLVGSI